MGLTHRQAKSDRLGTGHPQNAGKCVAQQHHLKDRQRGFKGIMNPEAG